MTMPALAAVDEDAEDMQCARPISKPRAAGPETRSSERYGLRHRVRADRMTLDRKRECSICTRFARDASSVTWEGPTVHLALSTDSLKTCLVLHLARRFKNRHFLCGALGRPAVYKKKSSIELKFYLEWLLEAAAINQ